MGLDHMLLTQEEYDEASDEEILEMKWTQEYMLSDDGECCDAICMVH